MRLMALLAGPLTRGPARLARTLLLQQCSPTAGRLDLSRCPYAPRGRPPHGGSPASARHHTCHAVVGTSDAEVGGAPSLALDAGAILKHLEDTVGPLSNQPMAPPPQARVIVISGPSGVGKDAVIKRLQQLRPDLYFVVTATSRLMRPGEVEGRDYFFVTRDTFERWVDQGVLLEHALVYGEYKGIPRAQVDAALAGGTDVVLRVDVQGAASVRRIIPGCVSIFIVAESERALVARLVARKTESLDRMAVRVATARQEVARAGEYDYVVVNSDGQLDECVAQIGAIIDVEKLRRPRAPPPPSLPLQFAGAGADGAPA